jgi:hypothetical protein
MILLGNEVEIVFRISSFTRVRNNPQIDWAERNLGPILFLPFVYHFSH